MRRFLMSLAMLAAIPAGLAIADEPTATTNDRPTRSVTVSDGANITTVQWGRRWRRPYNGGYYQPYANSYRYDNGYPSYRSYSYRPYYDGGNNGWYDNQYFYSDRTYVGPRNYYYRWW